MPQDAPEPHETLQENALPGDLLKELEGLTAKEFCWHLFERDDYLEKLGIDDGVFRLLRSEFKAGNVKRMALERAIDRLVKTTGDRNSALAFYTNWLPHRGFSEIHEPTFQAKREHRVEPHPLWTKEIRAAILECILSKTGRPPLPLKTQKTLEGMTARALLVAVVAQDPFADRLGLTHPDVDHMRASWGAPMMTDGEKEKKLSNFLSQFGDATTGLDLYNRWPAARIASAAFGEEMASTSYHSRN